jgi:hypothetical protein
MKTNMLKRARRLFRVTSVPIHTQRHNMRAWVRSVRFLGDKWLMVRMVEKATS